MYKPKSRTSKVVTVSAPVGGWNVKDPLPEMSKTDAIVLDNCFCMPGDIMVRKGYGPWATGMAGSVSRIFEYNDSAGSQEIFAATDNVGVCQVYDVTANGAVGAAVVSSLTSAKVRTSNFSNSGGSFLHMVNGSDNLRLYDGTTWFTVTDISATYAITGVDTQKLIDVVPYKRRIWFIEKTSMHCWYLAADAIAGAATKYDFGPIFSRGGNIVKIDTWTLDAGYGVDDYFLIFTSAGEVAVYRGDDPASIATWSLTGIFYIGSPTGVVGHTCKYGGDLLLLNKDGIAQMSKSLMSSRVNTHLSLTEKIQPQLAKDAAVLSANAGWEILLFPVANMLLVNVPLNASESYQYVCNTISGGWSRWKNIPARCWSFSKEMLLWGGAGSVYRMWDSASDNGSEISATIIPAFNTFGSDGQLKRWNMARVILATDSSVSYGVSMLVDFNQNPVITTLPSQQPPNVFTWDVSYWDSGAVWGGSLFPEARWRSVSGMGYWGALQVQIENMSSEVHIYAIDYNLEGGGVL